MTKQPLQFITDETSNFILNAGEIIQYHLIQHGIIKNKKKRFNFKQLVDDVNQFGYFLKLNTDQAMNHMTPNEMHQFTPNLPLLSTELQEYLTQNPHSNLHQQNGWQTEKGLNELFSLFSTYAYDGFNESGFQFLADKLECVIQKEKQPLYLRKLKPEYLLIPDIHIPVGQQGDPIIPDHLDQMAFLRKQIQNGARQPILKKPLEASNEDLFLMCGINCYDPQTIDYEEWQTALDIVRSTAQYNFVHHQGSILPFQDKPLPDFQQDIQMIQQLLDSFLEKQNKLVVLSTSGCRPQTSIS